MSDYSPMQHVTEINNTADELSLEHQLQVKQRELEALMLETSQIEQVSQELQLDLDEMSKQSVYKKYAYLTMKEIRNAMLAPCDGEPQVRDDNYAQLDVEDIVTL